jgi:hypothetical protein
VVCPGFTERGNALRHETAAEHLREGDAPNRAF